MTPAVLTMHRELQDRIDARTAHVAVVGLGYVGLPVACLFAEAGFSVTGVDIDRERVARLQRGESPIEGDEPGLAALLAEVRRSGRFDPTAEAAGLARSDVLLVCVETPVDPGTHEPRYAALHSACASIGGALRRGALVIVESTIAPGTMERSVRPWLEQASGLQAGADFLLGHCPERVMPGKLISNLRAMDRVCGGDSPETSEVMAALYRSVVRGRLDAVDLVTAELVKTVENAYRDVNIAFANEVAIICQAVGADALQVRELVNRSPGRNMLIPGAGVGGHCIPKDPWLLAAASDAVALRLIPAARAVNDGMPAAILDLLERSLVRHGRSVAGARIGILGYSYLQNTGDIRNSPSASLAALLAARGADVVIHDPFVAGYEGSIMERMTGCDAVAVMVAHQEYQTVSLAELRSLLRTPVLVDGRRVFAAANARSSGLTYRALGLGE